MLNEWCSVISRLCLSREISEMCVFANTQTGVGLRAGYLYERMRHCLGHALRRCRQSHLRTHAHMHTATRVAPESGHKKTPHPFGCGVGSGRRRLGGGARVVGLRLALRLRLRCRH
jgi:hypothetical protein